MVWARHERHRDHAHVIALSPIYVARIEIRSLWATGRAVRALERIGLMITLRVGGRLCLRRPSAEPSATRGAMRGRDRPHSLSRREPSVRVLERTTWLAGA